MNAQNAASARYDTVHRFARHHNALSSFLDPARPNAFNFTDFRSIQAEASNLASTAGPQRSNPTMASMQSEEEMANLQKLSNEYQPEIEGDLVGKREPSDTITAEYAHADPVYVQKTVALRQKYSYYRTVKGDGNCGWRAIAFGYFETLLRLGDRNRILAEETRLKSLNNLLNSLGFQEHLYEDFVEATLDLLRQISDSIPVQDDGAALLAAFNDPEISNGVITHFRLLTSAFMKSNADAYQPFLPDVSVEQYCASQIEPYQVEIEHLGMNALIDALIKPAGFAVDIVYLDRSAGHEANTIRFELQTPDGLPLFPDAPTMRLLYRPGHYDILYKIEDVPEMMAAAHTNPHIALVPSLSSYIPFQATPMFQDDMSVWADVPGMSLVSPSMAGSGFSSHLQTHGVLRETPMSSCVAPATPAPQAFPPSGLPVRSVPVERRESSFRPSKYEYEVPPAPSRPFQTSPFENSPYNSLHFMSEEFQPEIWTPGSESKSSRSHDHGRHRSRQ